MRASTLWTIAVSLTLACARAQPAVSTPAETPAETPAAPAEAVDYRLSPVFETGRLTALAVEIRLQGDASGVTRLQLPDRWAEARELHQYVRDLEVDGARTVVTEAPALRRIEAAPGAPLVVRYKVVSAFDREPNANDGQPFAPIVRPDWFYVFGEALFAAPEGREDAPARFTWTGAPAGFGFASDLEHLAGSRPGLVGDVMESIVFGGAALKLRAHGDAGGQIRVAVLGEYGFADEAFLNLAQSVIAAQRDFWGDHGAPFLVVMAPLEPAAGSLSLGGTGRSDAFALTVARNVPFEQLRHLLAHEYFHTWNPRELGVQREQDEMPGKWFAEGFTEFYAWRLLLRAGLYTLEDFIAAWNDALLEYGTSPVRNEPNTRIALDYWNDPDVSKLPYRRGPLLAAIWEQRLRQATAGARDLDDVLLAMRDEVRAATDREQVPDAAVLFPATFQRLGGPDLAADLERFIVRGEAIELPADAFGECIHVCAAKRPRFERGWDPEATRKADNVVTGLRRGSAAHRAGLRDGMKILARDSGDPNDATVPYVLRVRDRGRERRITFVPRGAGELTIQQLALIKELTPERRAACVRMLAGQ
jgi:predicted metalloprotease with PDZ domain